MNISLIPSVADRIALTLAGLCRAVAARVAHGAMAEAMILLVWQRIQRIDRRLQGLLRRFQEGRLVLRPAGRPGARGASRARRMALLPRRFGWLLPLVPGEAACFAGQIREMLAEPEMVALLAAAPQAGRVLGPLCRMLGIEAEVLEPGDAVAGGTGPDGPVGTEPAVVSWALRDGAAEGAGGVQPTWGVVPRMVWWKRIFVGWWRSPIGAGAL